MPISYGGWLTPILSLNGDIVGYTYRSCESSLCDPDLPRPKYRNGRLCPIVCREGKPGEVKIWTPGTCGENGNVNTDRGCGKYKRIKMTNIDCDSKCL